MAKAAQFNRNMQRRAQALQRNHIKLVNAIALRIDRNLLEATPVDIGVAISNWVLTLDRSNDGFEPAYSPGSHGSTHSANIAAAYSQAQYALSDRRMGQTIYISNLAPYIQELNRGSSSQAPSGFVQSSVLDAVRSVRNVRVII